MSLTRRNDEVARIVALLEDDTYPTAEALAFAVLSEATTILADRHLFALWSRKFPEVLFGPYFTEGQAEKAWHEDAAPILGAEGGAILRIAPWPSAPEAHEDKQFHPKAKCICGHPRWRHTNGGKKTYCGNRKDGCKCGGFTRP